VKKILITIVSAVLTVAVFLFGFFVLPKTQFFKENSTIQAITERMSVNQTFSSNRESQNINFNECEDWQNQDCNSKIRFVRVDNSGNLSLDGSSYAIIFDPKSKGLDFKVNLPLLNNLYEVKPDKTLLKNYTSKTFEQIVSDQNSTLDGQKPFAAINADYIDELNNPQGLNFSGGFQYSGAFANLRSSFGISSGNFEQRKATIDIGKRANSKDNYNVVGGNGRFYTNGVFKDICKDLGELACNQSTNRSMAAITNQGYVIFLVHQSTTNEILLPDNFDNILNGLSDNFDLGNIRDAILFDGGNSPAIMYNQRIYSSNFGPIGSVFLIYKK
jgi:hypothetical protein